tara:strand:+ start:53 stop:604 length:552 start_codon:yes stop_codon:yes gene_type:complete
LGGLFSHLHGECIEDFFHVVSRILPQIPKLEFHLYGQVQPKNFLAKQLNQNGVKHHGIVMPLEKRFEIMTKAHCFVIPSTFDPKSNLEYKFSFPTKLPELVASGRPILYYGPENTSTNHFLQSANIGICISRRSTQNLTDTLISIIKNYAAFYEKGKNARSFLKQDYSAKNVRKKLSEILKFY